MPGPVASGSRPRGAKANGRFDGAGESGLLSGTNIGPPQQSGAPPPQDTMTLMRLTANLTCTCILMVALVAALGATLADGATSRKSVTNRR